MGVGLFAQERSGSIEIGRACKIISHFHTAISAVVYDALLRYSPCLLLLDLHQTSDMDYGWFVDRFSGLYCR